MFNALEKNTEKESERREVCTFFQSSSIIIQQLLLLLFLSTNESSSSHGKKNYTGKIDFLTLLFFFSMFVRSSSTL
jgi:hypothetical protein